MKKFALILFLTLTVVLTCSCSNDTEQDQSSSTTADVTAQNSATATPDNDEDIQNEDVPNNKVITLDDLNNHPVASENDFKIRKIDNECCEIVDYIGSDEIIVFPDKIDGYTVTEIGKELFMSDNSIKAVKIPNSVKTIKAFAFGYADSLEIVICGEGVESIYSGAFISCSSLREVVLNDGLTKIYSGVFGSCSSLEELFIPQSVSYIDGDMYGNADGFVLKGIQGSYAEEYAKNKNYKFEIVE